MGWSFDDHTEFFTLPDLVDKFDLDRLNPSPAAINFSKLDHFNGLHIRALALPDLAARLKPFLEKAGYQVDDDKLNQIAPIVQERLVTFEDVIEVAGFFFEPTVNPKLEDLVGKNMTAADSARAVRAAYALLDSLPEINPQTAEQPLRDLTEQLRLKPGQFFGILRVAVTGRKVSPPLLESMAVIGKQNVLERLQNAIQMLEGVSQVN